MAQQIPDTSSTVVFRMDKMDYIDQSGLYVLEDILSDLVTRDIDVLLVGLPEQPCYLMERIDIIPDLVSKDMIFPDFESCLVSVSYTHLTLPTIYSV